MNCMLMVIALFGSVTGKIQGNVVDEKTQESIAFANVTILGTEISTAEMLLVNLPPLCLPLIYYHNITIYYARVRAGSSGWTNYTDWSECRRFYLRIDLQ